MTRSTFGWESLLQADAPSGCSLKAGLFTTYDRADERLLVEHFLPLLLNLGREFESEGIERQYFLLELDARLKSLHDKLVVVSSTMRDEPAGPDEKDDSPYDWIWRSIRHLTVGHQGKAVQHAKLWLLHWKGANESYAEHLEIVVSSANLTMDAFKGQLQGAWRTCIQLQPKPTKARLDGWGIVPDFLRELALSAGDGDRLESFIEILKRAECPAGVSFAASVPGTHSRQVLRRTPWGAAGLKQITPPGRGKVIVSALSPFIGTWTADALNQWCNRFDGSIDRLNLVWIDDHHPWIKNWLLPYSTMKALVAEGANFIKLRRGWKGSSESDAFHKQHRHTDPRWSHAKVYSLKRGNSHRLLLTSANFSTSAWGSESRDGTLTIKNFELGVCLEQGQWPFGALSGFGDGEVLATVAAAPGIGPSLIMWASAVWDGKKIEVRCRSDENRKVTGKIVGDTRSAVVTKWILQEKRIWVAKLDWPDDKGPPPPIQLRCERETLTLAVFDGRPWETIDSLPPGIDKDVAQEMRDELLFEQYGGRVATDENMGLNNAEDPVARDDVTQDDSEDSSQEANGGQTDSYAVPEFLLARIYFEILDNWTAKLERLQHQANAEFEHELLRQDGERLIDAFRRKSLRDANGGGKGSVGAELAAAELSQRLKYFPEM